MVSYEWDCELLDGDDIVDHLFADSFAEAMRSHTGSELSRVVLVRTVGNDDDGVTDRQWAYLQEDGTLPERFELSSGADGAKVPVRFHAEVARAS